MRRVPRLLVGLLASRVLGAVLLGCWAFLYAVFAIWSGEAFSRFAEYFNRMPVVAGLYWLFVVNLFLRNASTFRQRFLSRRLPALLAAVLPSGVILLLLGFGLSLSLKQYIQPLVGFQDVVRTPWGTRFGIRNIDPGLRDSILDVEQESRGIFTYEPSVEVEADNAVYTVKAFPPRAVGSDFLHILQFGIGPEVALSRGGRVFRRELHAMPLLPPPGSYTLELPPLPYEFQISLAPSRTFRKGGTVVNEYSIAAPLFHVRVLEDGRELARGTAAPFLAFRDLEISFPRWEPWAIIGIAHDPGILPTAGGLILTFLGLVLWPLSRPWRFARPADGAAPEHTEQTSGSIR